MVLLAVNFDNLHQILQSLYTDMMPLCSQMTGVAKGLAGLGALFYVAYRVWQSLARAEPIDVFPLLRPFALGICIMFFPTIVLGTLNSILSPVVTGTHRILETQTFDMNEYRQQKDKLEIEAMRRNPETAYLVDKEAFDNKLDELGALDAIEACGMYVDRAMYNMKKSVQNFFRELLELMFNAAALVVDTLRTFFLIVLSILGPISFAISCWDGFQASLSQWFVRYISIYLWLPVSDLFSSVLARIQTLMLQRDIEQLSDPNFIPDSSNAVYITFLIIGIIGYFTIPTVANWIVQAGGGAGNYGKNVNQAAARNHREAVSVLTQAKAHANAAQLKEIEEKIKAADTEMNRGSLFDLMEQEAQPEPSVQQQQPHSQQPVYTQTPVQRNPQPQRPQQPVPQRPQQAYTQHPQQPGIWPPQQQPPQPQARPQIQPHAQYVQLTGGQQPSQPQYPPQPEIQDWQEERFMQEDEQQPYLSDQEHPAYSEKDYEEYIDFPQSMLEPKYSPYQTV